VEQSILPNQARSQSQVLKQLAELIEETKSNDANLKFHHHESQLRAHPGQYQGEELSLDHPPRTDTIHEWDATRDSSSDSNAHVTPVYASKVQEVESTMRDIMERKRAIRRKLNDSTLTEHKEAQPTINPIINHVFHPINGMHRLLDIDNSGPKSAPLSPVSKSLTEEKFDVGAPHESQLSPHHRFLPPEVLRNLARSKVSALYTHNNYLGNLTFQEQRMRMSSPILPPMKQKIAIKHTSTLDARSDAGNSKSTPNPILDPTFLPPLIGTRSNIQFAAHRTLT
jgi:hypothetical protein